MMNDKKRKWTGSLAGLSDGFEIRDETLGKKFAKNESLWQSTQDATLHTFNLTSCIDRRDNEKRRSKTERKVTTRHRSFILPTPPEGVGLLPF